jgi:hypothetical protein
MASSLSLEKELGALRSSLRRPQILPSNDEIGSGRQKTTRSAIFFSPTQHATPLQAGHYSMPTLFRSCIPFCCKLLITNCLRSGAEESGRILARPHRGTARQHCRGGHGQVGSLCTVGAEPVSEAEKKIVFDKFHIAQHLGEAVDRVRRREHKQLRAEGDERLTGIK